jgi:flagellar protein FlbT
MSVAPKPSTRSITLKKGEKFFLNGALLRVDGPVKIEICTADSVLLPYQIMEEKDAIAPLHKFYYYVQQALIDGKNKKWWLAQASQLLSAPEVDKDQASAEAAVKAAEKGNLIDALRQLRSAIKDQYGSFNISYVASAH